MFGLFLSISRLIQYLVTYDPLKLGTIKFVVIVAAILTVREPGGRLNEVHVQAAHC